MPKIILVAHEANGRLRVRLPWIRTDRELAERIVSGLSGMDGVERVTAQMVTGSILTEFDAGQISSERLLGCVRRFSGVHPVARKGEESPEEELELMRVAKEEGNAVARALATSFRRLNLDVLRFTEGRADFATLLAVGLATGGAAEVFVSRKLPIPPWFNLAWWAFRTFATLERTAIMKAREPRKIPRPTRRRERRRRAR